MTYYFVHADDELMHHGIKGMKWGVRRYQNKNGSLTPEGKKRYSKEDSLRDSRIRKASHMSDMSDEQLRNETNRINLETNYKNAVATRYAKNGESFGSLGKREVQKALLTVTIGSVAWGATGIAKFLISEKVNGALGKQVLNYGGKKN